MRVAATAHGVELYFPPLRAPVMALALGMFGLTCLLLSLLAAAGLLTAGGGGTYGLLVIVLMAAFLAPFPVFGVVFIALAIYLLANSLTVWADAAGVRATRRLFGIAVRRRSIARAELAAIESAPAARYQSVLMAEPCFRLVARHAAQRARDVVVADALQGESVAAEVRALISRHAGLKLQ